VHTKSTEATAGGESGAREGGEGGARAGAGGWLSGLSPPLLKYQKTWSQGVQGRVSEAKHGRGGEGWGEEEEEEKEEAEEEDEAEGNEDRDAAPHGPRCMDTTDPATRKSCPTSTELFLPTEPGKQRLKMKAGRKK
jgi:hypothetical protein